MEAPRHDAGRGRLAQPPRRRLVAPQGTLRGLDAGQPTRATTRPTAEPLLGALKEITLTVLYTPRHTRHPFPLSRPCRTTSSPWWTCPLILTLSSPWIGLTLPDTARTVRTWAAV